MGSDGQIEAVIFDCDGVLADTMPLHYEAYCLAFKEVGLTLERDLFYRSSAGKASETLKKLLDGQNYQGDWRQLHQRKKELVVDLIASERLQPLAASRLVPLLSRGYRLAVASSGSTISVHQIIRCLGLFDYFEEIVTGDDVKAGKPDPESFLLVAEKMGIDPHKCLVIEDSQAGLEAALQANMQSMSVYSFIPQHN
jgi:beta-phosphoglucomutase